MEGKMAAEVVGCARNYGIDSPFNEDNIEEISELVQKKKTLSESCLVRTSTEYQSSIKQW